MVQLIQLKAVRQNDFKIIIYATLSLIFPSDDVAYRRNKSSTLISACEKDPPENWTLKRTTSYGENSLLTNKTLIKFIALDIVFQKFNCARMFTIFEGQFFVFSFLVDVRFFY